MREDTFASQLNNREFFVRQFGLEYPSFVDVFKALPPDRLDYRPHPTSRSAGELVALLVSSVCGCVDLCESGRGSFNSSLRFHPTTGSKSLQEMIAAFEHHHHALSEKIAQLDDASWNRPAWL